MPKKILVVDDEELIVKMVGLRLKANGYEVISAGDGKEGLAKAKEEFPDLIILDVMMPGMDGYKVCGLLKKDTRFAKIPVIMFTAKAQVDDKKIGEEVGANAYITKPFDPQVLLAKIRELLGESKT